MNIFRRKFIEMKNFSIRKLFPCGSSKKFNLSGGERFVDFSGFVSGHDGINFSSTLC